MASTAGTSALSPAEIDATRRGAEASSAAPEVPPVESCTRVFFFGTLRDDLTQYPDWSAPFLTEVSKHVSDVQDAFMPGVLMLSSDAPGTPGAYPASQVTDDPQHVLVGRLCTFDDPAAFCEIMKAADVIEGFTEGGSDNLYHRILRPAWVLDAKAGVWTRHDTWVYVYARPVEGRAWTPVPGGDWSHLGAAPLPLTLPTQGTTATASAVAGPLLSLPSQDAAPTDASAAAGDEAPSPPAQIIPDFLFLSSRLQAAHLPTLLELGITHIVRLTQECEGDAVPVFPHLTYLALPQPDEATTSLALYAAHALPFIQSVWGPTALKIDGTGRDASCSGRVLVHCRAGISRSASTVLMALVGLAGASLRDAWLHVHKQKPNAGPNVGFWSQLAMFEAKVASGGSPPRLPDCTLPLDVYTALDVVLMLRQRDLHDSAQRVPPGPLTLDSLAEAQPDEEDAAALRQAGQALQKHGQDTGGAIMELAQLWAGV